MDSKTINHILKLNRRFYEFNAYDFSATRNAFWPGWKELANVIREVFRGSHFSVLDIGSGNGRFYKFLVSENLKPLNYLGLDSSKKLNAQAQRMNPKTAFIFFDFVKDAVSKINFDADLVIGNGIMHHIPNKQQRLGWLKNVFTSLRTRGICVFTFWTDT